MRELGYVEGKEFILERRYAEGRYERFPELAAELVRLKVDVIVVAARAAAPAVQRATSTIPIVVTSSADPVGGKLAANLARPGGNITGLSSMTTETGPKQLELLKVMVPHLTRVAVLVNPNNSSGLAYLKAVREASHKLTLTVLSINASSPAELEHAFASMQQARADGLLVATDSLFLNQRQHIARLALGYRLPAIVGRKEYAEAGFLMSYGQSLGESTRRAASYVDKILKGAKPSELPMEQPMRFDLVINRKTADALGLAIPRELLLSADKVIE